MILDLLLFLLFVSDYFYGFACRPMVYLDLDTVRMIRNSGVFVSAARKVSTVKLTEIYGAGPCYVC